MYIIIKLFIYCDPDGARTRDPNIKSVVLYQLSYEVKPLSLTFNTNFLGTLLKEVVEAAGIEPTSQGPCSSKETNFCKYHNEQWF